MHTTRGSITWTFSEMVQDTIQAHGLKFAVRYYCKTHGLTAQEFRVFAGI